MCPILGWGSTNLTHTHRDKLRPDGQYLVFSRVAQLFPLFYFPQPTTFNNLNHEAFFRLLRIFLVLASCIFSVVATICFYRYSSG